MSKSIWRRQTSSDFAANFQFAQIVPFGSRALRRMQNVFSLMRLKLQAAGSRRQEAGWLEMEQDAKLAHAHARN